LHAKELVLNPEDTRNILTAVETMRSIVSSTVSSFAGAQAASLPSDLNQNVTIEANFPAVNSRIEIQEALSGLVSRAAQFATQTNNR
jgi:hypothetical protein